MSIGSPTTTLIRSVDAPTDAAVALPAQVMPNVAGDASYIWDQIDSVVRASVSSSEKLIGHLSPQTYRDVARGVRISDDDYQSRFAEIDLESFRGQMTPKAFQAFVRFMGILPGDFRVNVVDIATIPE